MFKKILIGIIAFGIIATLLLQIDDDLNPEIAAFLKQAEPAESSEAYLYLLGIVAAEDEKPLEVGKQLFGSMQQAEKQYSFGDDTFDYQDYPDDKKLALPQGELFCTSLEKGCWAAIFLINMILHQCYKPMLYYLSDIKPFFNLMITTH